MLISWTRVMSIASTYFSGPRAVDWERGLGGEWRNRMLTLGKVQKELAMARSRQEWVRFATLYLHPNLPAVRKC